MHDERADSETSWRSPRLLPIRLCQFDRWVEQPYERGEQHLTSALRRAFALETIVKNPLVVLISFFFDPCFRHSATAASCVLVVEPVIEDVVSALPTELILAQPALHLMVFSWRAIWLELLLLKAVCAADRAQNNLFVTFKEKLIGIR